jgi:CBS domain containing-hemolysin-like protein
MLTFIFAIIILGLAVMSVLARKAFALAPMRELKRRAANGNDLAKDLFRAAGYGMSLTVLLWAVTLLSLAGGSIMLVMSLPGYAAFLVLALVFWFCIVWLPSTHVGKVSVQVARRVTPALAWILQYTDPLLGRISRWSARHFSPKHSGLYELHDLLDLLDLQSKQADSRITTEELELMRNVLKFGDLKVRNSLRPRKTIKSIALDDNVGPILLDELHASGQTSFPVKKTARSKEIVGVLHIGDVGIHSRGKVEDYVNQGVTYIHESDSLADALHVFYQTKHQLFVVVNSFEEYVGVLTLQDVLQELLNHPPAAEELGSHDDKTAVAARHPRKSEQTVVE